MTVGVGRSGKRPAIQALVDTTPLRAFLTEVLHAVDLDEAIFELGLRSAMDASHGDELRDHMLAARAAMRERLASLGIQDWVERFDPAHYNRNATLA